MASVKRLVRKLLLRWHRLTGTAIVRHRGCLLEIDPHDYFIGSELIVDGTWEKPLIDVVERMNMRGRLALDIGAHVGIYTLVLSKIVGSDGSVIALEPDRDHFTMLQRNIARNHADNVDAICAAAGAIHTSGWLERHDPNLGGHRLVAHETSHPVAIVAVDTLVDPARVSFVKIDAEGSELEVLRGMGETLRLSPGLTILVEIELIHRDRAEQTAALLFDAGFQAAAWCGAFKPLTSPGELSTLTSDDRLSAFFSKDPSFVEKTIT